METFRFFQLRLRCAYHSVYDLTPIFDFHKATSALTTLRTIPNSTSSQVKTSLTVKNRFRSYIFTRRDKI